MAFLLPLLLLTLTVGVPAYARGKLRRRRRPFRPQPRDSVCPIHGVSDNCRYGEGCDDGQQEK